MIIRKALPQDLPAVNAIYSAILGREERGEITVGWIRGVYPTPDTARTALAKGELYVMEDGGAVVASNRINQEQCEEYGRCTWRYDAPAEQVLVFHTLTVDPTAGGRGYGTAFEAYCEQMARAMGCTVLRIDTNERNASARRMYARLGYREAGVVPTVFNGIPDVQLVLLEKKLI